MRIAIWTTMYPLPGNMHQGHAAKRLVYALREFCPGYQVDVYLFISPIGKWLLPRFSEKYRVKANALKSGPYEPGLHFRPIPILPKNMFARWINPFWQRHILSNMGEDAECDLILVHMCTHLSYGAVLTGKKRGVPVVLELRREMNEPGSLPSWKKKLLFDAVKMADVVVSPSAHLAAKCHNATGQDVQIIPSGTDTIFDEKPPSNLSRKRRVLFVGALDANKGIKALLQTSLKLFANSINFELFIVGESYFSGHSFRLELEKLAQGHPQVKFLGRITAEEVREQMRQAQLMCVPSYTETLGLVYFEAMKQGLPVIGRRGTGIDGIGEAGRDYEVISNDEELYSLLPALLEDSGRRLRLAEAGQRLASNWTWKNTALQHMAIFERLAHKRKIQCNQEGLREEQE
ncbi:MAG: glycosyltransferase family 4 protein [Planctomycetota bacterium]|jgi:glycosyltransferase involved in cell wall biosynthesis